MKFLLYIKTVRGNIAFTFLGTTDQFITSIPSSKKYLHNQLLFNVFAISATAASNVVVTQLNAIKII